MNRLSLLSATVIGLTLAPFTSSASAQADPRDDIRYEFAARRHLDELAYRLWQDANSVCWEMYRHYRHNPGFNETYREMYRVMEDARHVHDLVHEGAHRGRHDVDHIAADLYDIDKLFHHIEGDVRGWRSAHRGHYSHFGHYHGNHYGRQVHGHRFGDQLTRKLGYLETTLHHLMADCGVTSRLGDEDQPGGRSLPPVPPAPDYGPRLESP